MKIRTMWIAAVAMFLSAGISTNAQQRFEVTPFVGYETSGSYPLTNQSNSGAAAALVNQLRVNDALAFGTFLDYSVTENAQLEFMWNRNNTSYSAQSILTGQYFKAYNSTVDQFQFGGLYMFRSSDVRLRPYVAGSLGFTHDSNNPISTGFTTVQDRTEFSYSVGGGVKYYINRHVGLRGDVRYLPTYGSSSDELYCYYGCYYASVAHFLNRGSFVGGIVFKF
jgi:outer membrane protein W